MKTHKSFIHGEACLMVTQGISDLGPSESQAKTERLS